MQYFNSKNNDMDLYTWKYYYREDQLLQVQFWITRQDVQQLASVAGRLFPIGLIVCLMHKMGVDVLGDGCPVSCCDWRLGIDIR
jgi:hypothetical protein